MHAALSFNLFIKYFIENIKLVESTFLLNGRYHRQACDMHKCINEI